MLTINQSVNFYCFRSDKVLTYAVLLPGSEALLEDDPTADGGSHCAVLQFAM